MQNSTALRLLILRRPELEILSETRMFGGRQLTIGHESAETGTTMRCAVFLPPQEGPCPVV
ncbi:MAG: hypothetical protein ACPGGK_14910, partial [Pikeienuella sp.]